MKLDDTQMVITDENGKETICDILFTYTNEERNTSYVIFSVPDEDDLFAMKYDENSEELFYIEDDEEFDEVQEVIDAFYDEQEEKDED